MPRPPTIAVFDSGFGGLTVLRALAQTRPAARYVYLGDTARLPYGSKSAETITRYTRAAMRIFAERGADLAVIACNTASALALPELSRTSPLPMIGVIEPGARAAAQAVQARHPPAVQNTPQKTLQAPVLVLATEATVRSRAYAQACAAQGLPVYEKACPLLVPLVEEGWTDHAVTEQVAEIYLREAVSEIAFNVTGGSPFTAAGGAVSDTARPAIPGAVLLGCTHYPLLRTLLQRVIARTIAAIPIVDSAEATAAHVNTLLPEAAKTQSSQTDMHFIATDSPAKFRTLGQRFLGRAISQVEMIDLDR